jgi:type II secretory pathway pseudopilin PulG
LLGKTKRQATKKPSNRATAQAGFTLAGVVVILSIMLIFLAYTVPRQWSAVLRRDREQQTIFAMQQYARACLEFQKKNNAYPVNPNQLKEARAPRFIRGPKSELIDPLTGQVDWLVIPAAAAQAGGGQGGQGAGGMPGNNQQTPALPGVPLKDYAGGPFVGVRPPISGKAMLSINGNDTYETWSYTALDLVNDINKRNAALAQVLK